MIQNRKIAFKIILFKYSKRIHCFVESENFWQTNTVEPNWKGAESVNNWKIIKEKFIPKSGEISLSMVIQIWIGNVGLSGSFVSGFLSSSLYRKISFTRLKVQYFITNINNVNGFR